MRTRCWIGPLEIVVLCLAAAGCSDPSGPAHPTTAARSSAPAPSFADFDLNSDKKIDREEFKRLVNVLLRRMDTDKNGRLSPEEFKKVMGATARFEAFDINKDGRIDQAEFEKLADQLEQRVDADNDRSLDQQEYRALMDLTAPPPPARENARDSMEPMPGGSGMGSY